MPEENALIQQRLQKLQNLKERGINPYPYSFPRKEYSADVLEEFKKLKKEERTNKKVSVAGRVMTLRIMGKASFAHIQDQKGKIQIYVRENDVGEEVYKIFKKTDMGDFVGVEGTVFRTKMGEISVWVKKFELLCKSLRPLPEKWHGLQDHELRFRNRSLDLTVNPEIKNTFILRSKIIAAIREFLDKKGFLEVETPLLQVIYGGANARPFVTHINAWDIDLYLSISPELFLKRLVVGGMENVYTICKSFRNEGVDKTHNPEFTSIECYKAYVDYNDMMVLTEDLYTYVTKKIIGTTKINYRGVEINLKKPWPRLTMYDALKEYARIDVKNMSDDNIKELLRENNIKLEGEYNKGLAIQALFESLVETNLIQPVFLIDHPKETTPLCKAKRNNPALVERFEPYIMGWEVGNGYSELNDPIVQRELLEEQAKKLRGGMAEAHPMDEDFIRAIEQGMPPAAGLGLGIDRMVMLLTNSTSIRDVILFPIMKPEQKIL